MKRKHLVVSALLFFILLFTLIPSKPAHAKITFFDYELFKEQLNSLKELIFGKSIQLPQEKQIPTQNISPPVTTSTSVKAEQKPSYAASKFTKTLERGMHNEEVKKLQLFLKQFPDIYFEGIVTGYFGSLTEAAVKRFQKAHGIEQVGIVGPKTRAKINDILVSGGVVLPTEATSNVSPSAAVSLTVPPSDVLPSATPPPNQFSFPLAPPLDKLRTAAVLEIPLPRNAHCISDRYSTYFNEPECYASYHPQICRNYANPVSDQAGVTYPSACWADELGAQSFNYGYSERMTQFIHDLWQTPRGWNKGYKSFEVPKPHIDFSFGSNNDDRKLLHSTLWSNSKNSMILDYYYDPKSQKHFTSFGAVQTLRPVYGERKNLLLAMVLFDEVYPEKTLLEAARSYESGLNNYLRKKQNVPNPVQFDITPVVIPPPAGVPKPPPEYHYYASHPDEISKIYDSAVAKAGKGNYYHLAIVPVLESGPTLNYGGAISTRWNNLDLISFFISSQVYYSETDVHRGLQALSALRFTALSHELLHVLGWSEDHDPLQGRSFDLDPKTGENLVEGQSACDYLGESFSYAIELPPKLAIRVGSEPAWTTKLESATGQCLYARERESIGYLKDYDKNGTYEQVFSEYNFSPMELLPGLARSLGWVDIDGDGVGEVADPNPYGGYGEIVIPARSGAILTKPLVFESLENVEFQSCKFKRIRLENGESGLLPIQCKEFNEEIVNVYRNLEYRWLKVPKDYGLVLLPRLPGWASPPTTGITFTVVDPEEWCEKIRYPEQTVSTVEAALSNQRVCGLGLSRKNLETFPAELTKITQLFEISLNGNNLTSLPETIGDLSNLRKLNLSQNKLTALPESISNLSRLKELDLGGNNLSVLPTAFFQLSNLRILDLSQNKLTELPPEIGNLQELMVLKLDQTPIKRLPPEIRNLKNLREISVFSGYSTEVPPEIFELRSLNILTLAGAVLKAPISLVGNLRELRQLTLGDVGLIEIPKETFSLKKLVSLKLFGNYLTGVPKEIGTLTKLRWLSLRDNYISSVPVEIAALTHLRELDLSQNPVSREEIEKLKKLLPHTKILYDGNEVEWLKPKFSEISSPTPSSLPPPGDLQLLWGGGGKSPIYVGVYNQNIRFKYDDSRLAGVGAFRLYYKEPTDTSRRLVAEFSNPAGVGTCSGGSLRSGTWTLYFICPITSWSVSSFSQNSFYYSVGEHSFYMTVVDKEGKESLPSATVTQNVLERTEILSPTASQSPTSQTPEFRWTVASGWPTGAKTIDYYIVVSDGASKIYEAIVRVNPRDTREGVKKYDGPPLDPSKKYLVYIRGAVVDNYISMNKTMTTFWVTP